MMDWVALPHLYALVLTPKPVKDKDEDYDDNHDHHYADNDDYVDDDDDYVDDDNHHHHHHCIYTWHILCYLLQPNSVFTMF